MATIHYLAMIRDEHGAIARVSTALDERGTWRPLVATDRGVLAAGLADRLTVRLDGDDLDGTAEAASFDHTHAPDPRPVTSVDCRRILADSFTAAAAA